MQSDTPIRGMMVRDIDPVARPEAEKDSSDKKKKPLINSWVPAAADWARGDDKVKEIKKN